MFSNILNNQTKLWQGFKKNLIERPPVKLFFRNNENKSK